MVRRAGPLVFLAPWLILAQARGEDDSILVRAAWVIPASTPPIEQGQILVRGGRIEVVGRTIPPERSAGARIVDVPGVVTPGLIDCGSDIAVVGRSAEEWNELTPEVRVLGAVDFDHPELARSLAEGITLAAVGPGARNVVGGLGCVMRIGGDFLEADRRVVRSDAFLELSLGEEASAGNFNLRASRPLTYTFRIPNTRMGTVFLARRVLFEALDQPDTDAVPALLSPSGKEIIRQALTGRIPLRVHADAAQEIDAALRLIEEVKAEPGPQLQIVGGAEAVELLPRLKAAGASVLLYPGTTNRDLDPELYPRYTVRLPVLLAEAGIPFAYASRDGDEVARLRSRAALGLEVGLSPEQALRALTIDAACILRVDDRVGSIEPGKDADLAAFSGDPLSPTSEVLWTMTAGRFDMEKERKL